MIQFVSIREFGEFLVNDITFTLEFPSFVQQRGNSDEENDLICAAREALDSQNANSNRRESS